MDTFAAARDRATRKTGDFRAAGTSPTTRANTWWTGAWLHIRIARAAMGRPVAAGQRRARRQRSQVEARLFVIAQVGRAHDHAAGLLGRRRGARARWNRAGQRSWRNGLPADDAAERARRRAARPDSWAALQGQAPRPSTAALADQLRGAARGAARCSRASARAAAGACAAGAPRPIVPRRSRSSRTRAAPGERRRERAIDEYYPAAGKRGGEVGAVVLAIRARAAAIASGVRVSSARALDAAALRWIQEAATFRRPAAIGPTGRGLEGAGRHLPADRGRRRIARRRALAARRARLTPRRGPRRR
ncbi:MAG: hypothetical protein U1F30_04900 [Steroidobacteraceae bacterium]